MWCIVVSYEAFRFSRDGHLHRGLGIKAQPINRIVFHEKTQQRSMRGALFHHLDGVIYMRKNDNPPGDAPDP
jgi:hypothetical protein